MCDCNKFYPLPDCPQCFPITEDDREMVLLTTPEERLEELRIELRAERISYGELIELQNLTEYIQPDDVELLEAAGVPEFVAEYATETDQKAVVKPLLGDQYS